MRFNDAQSEGAILSFSLSSNLPLNIPSLADNILNDDPVLDVILVPFTIPGQKNLSLAGPSCPHPRDVWSEAL